METARPLNRYYVVVNQPGGGQTITADMSPESFDDWRDELCNRLSEGPVVLCDNATLWTRIEPGPGVTIAFMTEDQFKTLFLAQQQAARQARQPGLILPPR